MDIDQQTTTVAAFDAVEKRFGAIKALAGVSFEVRAGRTLALLGPNGAGKSTALSILVGLRRPDSGAVWLFGKQPGDPATLARLGVTPQASDFPETLTPRELLGFAAAHYANPADLDGLIEQFGLSAFADRRARGFSGGQKRRLALAMAFCGRPDLVVLDEPTAGLDATARRTFQNIVRDYVAAGGAAIITSHDFQEIERLADNIVMIDRGQVVLEGSVEEIRAAAGLRRVSFKGHAPPAEIAARARLADGRWSLIGADSDDILRLLVQAKGVADIEVAPLPLEEAIDAWLNANQGRGDRT